MKGLSISAGFVSWFENEADEDAYILQILGRAGAVFYCRTTEPQTLVISCGRGWKLAWTDDCRCILRRQAISMERPSILSIESLPLEAALAGKEL